MIVILVATKEECELAKKHLPGYVILCTGVGASNVIHTLANRHFSNDTHYINVGFAGSNKLPVGTVTMVSESKRLLDGKVEFEDYRNGYFLATGEGYPCYTSNNFVTENTSEYPVVYDMELNYIVAFPIDLIGSVKIVSDNLDVIEYQCSIDTSSTETWRKVKECVDKIAALREP